jgi:hypothetical protein
MLLTLRNAKLAEIMGNVNDWNNNTRTNFLVLWNMLSHTRKPHVLKQKDIFMNWQSAFE